jgi:BirA family biotin operon repressor/biotin-[acetyl-CoA-carboxylase] ligase
MNDVWLGDAWPDDLRESCGHLRHRLVFRETVGSTNDDALHLAARGAAPGMAVVADQQQTGRGRQGRSWWSPPGAGMYLSAAWPLPRLDASTAVLTLAAGAALATAVRTVSGLPVELKWPNDLMLGRPWRKLAGILCEAVGQGTAGGTVVVGMGVNVRRSAYPREIADRVTSLEEETSRPVSRGALVAASLEAMDAAFAAVAAGRLASVLDTWRSFGTAALATAGVRWRDQDGEHQGTTIGLADDGALLVRPAGRDVVVAVRSGEVIWEMLARE